MRPLTAATSAVATGVALGVASRFVATGDARRGMLCLVTALGLACSTAAAWNAGGVSVARRCRSGAVVVATSFAAAWAAAAASGNPSLVASAAVVAGAAAAAFGAATLCRARGVSVGRATFVGAAVPVASAALLFVADPFVEWNGSTTAAAPERAAVVVAVNPIASIAADARFDWQRSKWLYEGPTPGAPGLSVIGQYYPSRPTAPWTWAFAAAALGFAALTAAGARRQGVSA